jgi:hypothetical protein
VYENLSKWHIRSMGSAGAIKAVFWSVYTLNVVSPTAPPPELLAVDAASRLQEPIVTFYTHPAWSSVGLFIAAACIVGYRAYARNLVSRLTYNAARAEIQIYCHTLWGAYTEPRIYKAAVVEFAAPMTKHKYIMGTLPDTNGRLFIDRDGKFTPPFATPEGTDQVALEAAVFRAIGTDWSQSTNAQEPLHAVHKFLSDEYVFVLNAHDGKTKQNGASLEEMKEGLKVLNFLKFCYVMLTDVRLA